MVFKLSKGLLKMFLLKYDRLWENLKAVEKMKRSIHFQILTLQKQFVTYFKRIHIIVQIKWDTE